MLEEHGSSRSTRSSRRARDVERVVSRRDVISQVKFGLIAMILVKKKTETACKVGSL